MKHLSKLLILSLLIQISFGLFTPQALASGTTYYVANAGNDACDGKSQTIGSSGSCAWKTIAKVNSSTFSPGDSILFNKGDTWREQLTVPSSGTLGNVITFGSYGSGNLPIIDGSDVITGWAADASSNEETGGVFASGIENETDAFNSSFTSKTEANSNTIITTTTVGTYNNGAKGAVISYAGTQGYGTYAIKTFGSNAKYLRAYFKLDSSFTANAAAQKIQLFSIGNSTGWNALASIILVSDVGQTTQFHLQGHYRYPGSNWTNVFTGANNSIQRNVWYYVEIHYEKGVSTTIEFWLNGVSQGSVSAINTNSYNPDRFYMGASGQLFLTGEMNPTNGSKIYFDDIKADTSAVGAYSLSAPVANVYNKVVSAQPNQVFKDGIRLTLGSSKATLNDHEWYYSGGTLSVRDDSGNPDSQGYTILASARDYNINENGKSYITFQNLNLQRANQNGLYFSTSASNIIIDGITSSYSFQNGIRSITSQAVTNATVQNSIFGWNGASGIFVGKSSHDWSINHNEVYNNGQYNDSTGDHDYTSGIHTWSDDGSIVNMLIEYNHVYNNGILPDGSRYTGSRGAGIWTDTLTLSDYTPYAIIRYNLVHDNGYAGIYVEHGSFHQVYNNIVYGTVNGDGIRVADYTHVANAPTSYNKIYNNTVYNNNYTGIYLAGSTISTANDCIGNIIKNNIALNNGRNLKAEYGCENDGTMGSGNIYLYNSFGAQASSFIEWGHGFTKSTYSAWETAYGGTTNSIQTDPQLNNPSSNDFTLQSSSPAIDTGVSLGDTYTN